MTEESVQPQPTPNQKSINWKRVLIVVVTAAVVIGLGLFIFFILQPEPETTSTVTTKKATPSATIATPSVKKDETTDWKIYSSKTHSIKYPDDWVLRECEGNVSFAPNNSLLGVCQSGHVGLVSTLQIDYIDYKKYLSQSDPSPYDNYLQQKTNVSGKEAIRTSGTYNGTVEGTQKGTQTIIYIVNSKDKGFMIKYFRYPEGEDYSNIFETMVSTFKFLD